MTVSAKGLYSSYIQSKKCIKWFFDEDKKTVKKNVKFQNKHRGKRCFILGNGPSLNQHDLSLIKNEIVFCVNEFVRYDKTELVHPDYYVIADPKFFDLNSNIEEDKQFIDMIMLLESINRNIQFFVPVGARSTVEKYGWSKVMDFNYFKNGLIFGESYTKRIVLDSMIPSVQAVVQYAILIAIYMGFSEIYLLGTEQTNIFGNLKAFMSSDNISDYAFSMTDKERAWKNKKLTEYSLPGTLRGYARIFELYDQLYLYCQRQGVKIYNCVQETLIQSIPKANFETLLIDK